MNDALAVLAAVFAVCGVMATPVGAVDGPGAAADAMAATNSGTQADGGNRTIDSCREIATPGVYELTADVAADGSGSCLVVSASDVVLDGNGHTVNGTGVAQPTDDSTVQAGIAVESDSETTQTNVTIRDVDVRGCEAGIAREMTLGNITVRNTTAADNDQGIRLDGADTARLTNVTLVSNGIGLTGVEANRIEIRSSAVRDNEHYGVSGGLPTQLVITDTAVTGNGAEGVRIGSEWPPARLANVTVSDNGGPGILVREDAAGGMITDSVVVDNGGDGIRTEGGVVNVSGTVVRGNGGVGVNVLAVGIENEVTMTSVTVADNADLELDARNGSATATALQIGTSAAVGFENRQVALEPVERDDLPAIQNGTAVGAGLNVTDPDGPVRLSLDYDADGETVELWRYDGTQWSPVGVATMHTDSLDGTTSRSGIYAPVVPDRGSESTRDAAVSADGADGTVANSSDTAVVATADDGTITVDD